MGTQTLITIEQAELDRIHQQLEAITARLDSVAMSPKPEWLTVKEYSAEIGKHPRTVTRWIERGKLETKEECGVTLIKAPR